MSPNRSEATAAEPISLMKWSRILLVAAFVLSLLIVLTATLLAPDVVPAMPLALIGIVCIAWLFRHPRLNLLVVLATFPLVTGYEAGVDLTEFLFGIYFSLFLGHWYFRKVILEREQLIRSFQDRMIVFLFCWITGYVFIGLMFGAEPLAVRNEYIPFLMLGFYFPIKRIAGIDNGIKALLLLLLWMGAYVAIRNYLALQELVTQATQAWQITTKGRAETNEILLLAPAFAMLVWGAFSKRLISKIVLFALFLALTFGLVMTQSRGYWAAAGFGALLMIVSMDRIRRVQLITLGSIGVAVSALLVVTLFGDRAMLLIAGLWNRLLTLGPSLLGDVSLENRILESKAVLNEILKNPILGYGMGVPYEYFNITVLGTRRWSFIHNGYLSMWYRFGIVGLTIVMVLWLGGISRAVGLLKVVTKRYDKVRLVLSASVLGAMLISALTSSPFYQMDLLLMMTMFLAIVSAVSDQTSSAP